MPSSRGGKTARDPDSVGENRRSPVDKQRSAAKFRKDVSSTKAANLNAVRRGGIRL